MPFGQENNHKGHGKMRAESPRGKSYLLSSPHPFQFQNQPMVLSRRTSYKIANGSPRGHSPVVAMELKFDSPAQARKKFKGNNSSSAKPIR
eukprot:scaffold17892_cov82-Skeletonema_marinoi.AAC.1